MITKRELLENKLRKMIREELNLSEAISGPPGWRTQTFERGDIAIYQPRRPFDVYSKFVGKQGKIIKLLAGSSRDMGVKTYDIKMQDGTVIRCNGKDLKSI